MEKYLDILQDSLKQKHVFLKELHTLCDEQEKLLKASEIDLDAFDGIVDQKDGIVDQIIRLDNGFESLYNDIKEKLLPEKAQHKVQIEQIQEMISQTMDLTASLQAKELRIRKAIDTKLGTMKKDIGQSRRGSKVAYDYYVNMAGGSTNIPTHFTEKS